MKVLAHLDPRSLEQALVRRVARVQPRDLPGRTLVVVPTVRLAAHVQRRLAAVRDAWLGVDVLAFTALSREILDKHGVAVPRIASPRLLEALLRRVLDARPRNPWTRFARRRPGAVRRLLASIEDLRDASVKPAALARHCSEEGDRALAQIYRDYTRRLEALAERGWVDDAGLVQAALPHAGGYAARFRAIFLHGAYELIGTRTKLIRALDRGGHLTLLLPAQAGAPASAYAESFARRHLLTGKMELEPIEGDGGGARLSALYREDERPEPAPGRFGFRHTQGVAAEVKIAVREALEAIREGCPPEELILAARNLEPYAAALEATFGAEGLPWTSSLEIPLRRHPLVHDLMLTLRLVEQDFPRRATAELLRSPRVRWKSLLPEEPAPRGNPADRWSREAGIIGGLEEWSNALPAWAGDVYVSEDASEEERAKTEGLAAERVETARHIGRALRALHDRVEPARGRRWSEHADRLQELVPSLFRLRVEEDSHGALDALDGLLDEMRALESVVGEDGPVEFSRTVDWLDSAVDGAKLALHSGDRGGVRVLDAMQMRGLTCRRLLLLGMNGGQFPRPPREDPILGDDLRMRVRESENAPLPVKSEGIGEERLLLSMLLGSASERVEISWQRADESGRARTPSIALREVARLALGRPDLDALVHSARHLPSHPEHWLEQLAAEPGLLSPSEERLLTVLRGRGPDSPVERWYEELGPGLRMLRATESFRIEDAGYDGRIGTIAGKPEAHSVSALETLGLCPLKYLFRSVLRVGELQEESSVFELDRREMGMLIHDLLDRLYRSLQEHGLFEPGNASERRKKAEALLDREWRAATTELEQRYSGRVPVLWALVRDSWTEALRLFLREDLARVQDEGLRPVSFEERIVDEIPLGDLTARVSGRFDRRFEGPDGMLVGDYKTSGDLTKRGDVTQMLKGNRLQVPLYRLLSGASTAVELIGVGPTYEFDGEAEESGRRVRFAGFDKEEQLLGFAETLRELMRLIDRGTFPLRAGEHCAWCAYHLACRRTHPPTLQREESAPDTENFRLLREKNKSKKPTLELVRGDPRRSEKRS